MEPTWKSGLRDDLDRFSAMIASGDHGPEIRTELYEAVLEHIDAAYERGYRAGNSRAQELRIQVRRLRALRDRKSS